MENDRAHWNGLLAGQRQSNTVDVLVIETPLQQSPRGGSGVFLAADTSNQQWWVKPLNNMQSERVTITEAVIGAVGRIIGAPVCETEVVMIPEELRGWEFLPGRLLEPGLAHASRAVEMAIESRELLYRNDDDNRRRHAGVFALYDWCWGGDDQWLYSRSDENCLFSHDHGWYLPERGATWDEASLVRRVDQPHLPVWSSEGIDEAELLRLAERLRGVTTDELAAVLRSIPHDWPVIDSELECLGWFLQRRTKAVATRLERLARGEVV